ncbi:hypothetical protein C8J57DRAFT_1243485 [Mycena rebaudengoi]|nr:hypothetical protein C8J57DRAFT_1243485 [Mycena rebaudengoi]
MKAFISTIFAAFVFVAPASGFSSPLNETATLDLRTTQTCEDPSDLAPFFQLYVPSVTAHIYTIYDNNVTNIMFGNPGCTFLGVAALIFSIPDPSTVPLFCLRNNARNAYFYTTNQTERVAAIANG